MKSSSIIASLSLLLPLSSWAFVTPSSTSVSSRPNLVTLSAKKTKKKRSSASGEGFGKSTAAAPVSSAARDEPGADIGASGGLQSIEESTSSTPFNMRSQPQQLDLDPNLSPEEKSQAILRQKFGLKSYEEQQADLGDYRLILDAEKKKEKRDKLRNIDKLWPEDKDFVALLPPGVIKGIDTFLKLGLGLCTVLFLLAGVFITIEAGSKATANPLPIGLETFIVNIVEPNFTPGLLVLLGFSVSLGLFSIGLGGSASSTYRENP